MRSSARRSVPASSASPSSATRSAPPSPSGSRSGTNALTPGQVEAAVAGLADFLPAGGPEHVDLVSAVDLRADLALIAVPTLVIATAQGRPRASRALPAARRGHPGAELVEVAAGHDIASEAREAWLTAIRSLLARVG